MGRIGLALILATLALSGALTPLAAPLAQADGQQPMAQQPSNPLDPAMGVEAQTDPIEYAECLLAGPVLVFAVDSICEVGDRIDEEALEDADAHETRVEIYASGSTTAQQTNNSLTGLENRLTDAQTIALMEGKNAAIREMNNGSTQVQAEEASQNAIENYYATLQINLNSAWETEAAHAWHLEQTAENASGVDEMFISSWRGDSVNEPVDFDVDDHGETTVQMVNGTSISTSYISIEENADFDVTGVPDGFLSQGVAVRGVDSDGDVDDDPILIADSIRYGSLWTDIQNEEDSVTTEVQDGFIANVYPSWEEGDINTTDLIDPYLCSRDYGPEENFQTWAACSLTSLGLNSPENMTNMGFMEIASGSQVYEGQLLSDGLPEGDAFEIGETYDADEIAGVQAVVTADDTVQLDGEFTLLNATDADGNTFNESESIVYRNTTYETTNTEEYQELMDDLSETAAGIEAWQQQLRSGGGGGLFAGLPIGWVEAILIAALLIAIVAALN